MLLVVAFLSTFLSESLSLKVNDVPVLSSISCYAISSAAPVREIHAFKDVTEYPAGLENVMVGLSSSVKFGADVIVAALGMYVNAILPLALAEPGKYDALILDTLKL